MLERLWTPVGAGVKSEEEVDALASTCSPTAPRAASRSARSTETISEIPGLEGLTLLEDYLDAARRAAERPGWAGVQSMPAPVTASANGNAPAPAPAHWATVGAARDD